MNFEKISIKEDFIRLDSAMKLANLVSTGGHAKIVIQDGEVLVKKAPSEEEPKGLFSDLFQKIKDFFRGEPIGR